MSFEIKPKVINTSDVIGLPAQISSIQAGNQNVIDALATKGAVVPDTYKQHTIDIYADKEILLAADGKSYYSINRVDWAYAGSLVARDWNIPGSNGSMFVAINSMGIIKYSYDGFIWNNAAYLQSSAWYSRVNYLNNKFIVFSYTGQFAYSENGITWTLSSNLYSQGFYNDILSNGTILVTHNYRGEIATSNDGINWSISQTLPYNVNDDWGYRMAYGNGCFILLSTSGKVAHSYNGINWMISANFSTHCSSGVFYLNDMFIAPTGVNPVVIKYSKNGTDWLDASYQGPVDSQWQAAYGNNKFVMIGMYNGVTINSADGISWATGDFLPGQPEYMYRWSLSSDYKNNKFLAIKNNGKIAYSSNGYTWIETILPNYNNEQLQGKGSSIRVNATKTIADILGV